MQVLQEQVEAARELGVPAPPAVAADLETLQRRWNLLMHSGAEVECVTECHGAERARPGAARHPGADADP